MRTILVVGEVTTRLLKGICVSTPPTVGEYAELVSARDGETLLGTATVRKVYPNPKWPGRFCYDAVVKD